MWHSSFRNVVDFTGYELHDSTPCIMVPSMSSPKFICPTIISRFPHRSVCGSNVLYLFSRGAYSNLMLDCTVRKYSYISVLWVAKYRYVVRFSLRGCSLNTLCELSVATWNVEMATCVYSIVISGFG